MTGLLIAVILGAAVLTGGLAQARLRVPAAWVWLLLGGALSFVPRWYDLSLPPDVVLYLFLPVLLFWETINTSLQLIRRNLRVILLLGVSLVFLTAAAVSGLGRLVGLSLSMSLVLGAVLAPTEATAVATLAPRLPRRVATVLRGESLINDASALALYSIAVAAAAAGQPFRALAVSLAFGWAVVGGVMSGVAASVILLGVRRIARRVELDGTISLLSPFLLFLPAQLVGASGVVAVVTGGVLLSRLTPAIMRAEARNQASTSGGSPPTSSTAPCSC